MGSALEINPNLLHAQEEWAQAASHSDIIPDSYRNKPANVLIAVGFGASMGLSPSEALYRINVIKGKPTMSAELIAAQVRKAGHKLRIAKDEQKVSATATIVRADDPDYPISVTRDMAWAQRIGLANNPNYQKQPLTMLVWRSITAAAREACPEALYGVAYTPDEMFDLDDVTAVPQQQRQQEESAPVDPSPSREDCDHIIGIMKQAGVHDPDSAARAFTALVGHAITNPDQLTLLEAEQLLSSDDMLLQKTRQALAEPTPEAARETDAPAC